ncbi:MAG: phage portal protein [Epibacterium sp.]
MMHFSNASLLDRAILAVSPVRGLTRIQAKARASILMNYDAGGMGRRVKGMKAPATDADAASLGSRRLLRQRSRDLIRNAPFAKRAQSVVTNNVVGAGIAPSITGSNKAAADAASKVILPFLQSTEIDAHRAMNFATMQSVVCNSVFESGEVLAIRRTVSDANATLPLRVEILEIDHLDSTVQSHGDNEVIDGIEYDAETGVVVGYWIFQQHPGSATRKRTLKSSRVPASDVLHIRRIDRPGQMRGVPWLAPVMVTLAEMRDYQEAQILKQKISALLAGVVTGSSDGVPEGASGLDKLSPGGIAYLEDGQEITFTDPPRVDDYNVVMRLGLWAVAMGIGITGESLSGDLSNVNFSSMRAGRLEMDKNVETWQEQILIAQFCAGVGRWALDAYRLRAGKRVPPLGMAWTAQRRALIDPTKEIPAIIKKIEAGLSSRSREQRAMGLDPDTIARERVEDAARPSPATDEPRAGSETQKGNSS